MKHPHLKHLPAAFLLAGLPLSSAYGALIVPAGNPLVVNDTDMNIAWTRDANLFKTMAAGDPDLVSKIIAVTPSYNDLFWGEQTIDDGIPDDSVSFDVDTVGYPDFDTATGSMTWWGGQAWVNYLNSIQYAGQTGWRLPVVTPVNGSNFNWFFSHDGSADWGPNTTAVNVTASELAHIYYNELGNLAAVDIAGNPQPAWEPYGPINTGPFQNLESATYWSGTDFDPYWYAVSFGFQSAEQYPFRLKFSRSLSWAVRPGEVAAVPIPAAGWLFGGALLGLVGFRRRAATSDLG